MADNATQSTASSEQTNEIITVSASRVSCNGGGGALGHPQIWLTIGQDGSVTCPYCSRQFVQSQDQ